jgi:DNA-directed RNA polymerase specialized sigma24 family protein
MSGSRESANGKRARLSNRTPAPAAHEVTQLLADWSHGDQAALEKLTPLVYEELWRLAHHYMERQSPGHTLQTTALVNEAYLRLAEQNRPGFTNRAHFFAVAAKAMRQILVNHANAQHRQKRKAHVVELKYFGGLTQDEIAEVLKISSVTVRRDWVFARAWLYSELHNAA